MTFSGTQIHHVRATDRIALQGGVSHPNVDPYNGAQYYLGGACSNGWTDANSVVKRSIFIDGFEYSISDLRLKMNDLRHLTKDIADIPLTAQ
jgi:hypothetical protein